ncbi:MAG: glycosyltransferase [Bacteroidales bacterium]|nr:glycosyltransferase [Bacteroidales bacterium]
MDKPLVSICCLTYNHGRFISRCLDGFLMQKTSFAFEALIHDDASTDNNADIIRAYEAKYPDIIKPVYQTENRYSRGLAISEFFIYPRVQGKYMALCEGDDYWTDPNKLQRQVDFLEANPQYCACAHQCMSIYDYRDSDPKPFNTKIKDSFDLNDLLDGCVFQTATIMFRTSLIGELEKMPNEVFSGDRGLFFLCTVHSPVKFFPEPMSVYRINRTGVSTTVTYKHLIGDLRMIPWLIGIFPHFPRYHYTSYIYKTVISYPPRVPFPVYMKYYFLYAWYSFSFFPKNIRPLLKFTFLTTPKFAVSRLFPNLKWKRLQAWR